MLLSVFLFFFLILWFYWGSGEQETPVLKSEYITNC